MTTIDTKLAELGIDLPVAAAPVANYVSYVISGNLVFISGQISKIGETEVKGRLGEGLTVEQGQAAAKLSALNLIAQMKAALGSLDRVERVVKLGAFIASAPSFTDQPKVANGASELMVEVFGEAGKHTRSAVGVPVLPLGAVVEIDAVVLVRAAD